MKDRIRQIMEDKAMSQKSFASELCIAEATLSGIFNGRTRPTLQTISAIHERFPEINISWLQFGEGQMYAQPSGNNIQGDSQASSSLDAASDSSASAYPGGPSASGTDQFMGDLFAGQDAFQSRTPASGPVASQHAAPKPTVSPEVKALAKFLDKPQRKITEIRIFFDDGTYETFTK